MKEQEIIPENVRGIQTNTEANAVLPDEGAAKEFYQVVKNRLLHINQWREVAGKALCGARDGPDGQARERVAAIVQAADTARARDRPPGR